MERGVVRRRNGEELECLFALGRLGDGPLRPTRSPWTLVLGTAAGGS